MPMNRSLYPPNWDEIALKITTETNWTCEQCKRPCRRPGESVEQLSKRLGQPIPHPQQYCLTVAHLDHRPENCDRANLRALCAPCHCRYDLSQMGTKQRLKRERKGQLNLLNPVDRLGLDHGPGGNGDCPQRTQLHLGDIGRMV